MDKQFTAAVGTVMAQPGVEGILCAGLPIGLSLAATGISPPNAAGFVASLANRAHSLEPKGPKPTVVIETTFDV